jgi:hypothetical protein
MPGAPAARRARLARARASASAREAAQLAQPRFKVDALGDVVPDIRAEAAIIYNPTTRQVLWEEKAFDQRSIASINRVMTAVCFLEDNPDLGRQVFVDRGDTLGAPVTYLRAYERVSVQDLLHLLLIASDNAAAGARNGRALTVSTCAYVSGAWGAAGVVPAAPRLAQAAYHVSTPAGSGRPRRIHSSSAS